jgi:hypothetical protein
MNRMDNQRLSTELDSGRVTAPKILDDLPCPRKGWCWGDNLRITGRWSRDRY